MVLQCVAFGLVASKHVVVSGGAADFVLGEPIKAEGMKG
jgi:hypothetical protein